MVKGGYPLRFSVLEADADKARKLIVASGYTNFTEVHGDRDGRATTFVWKGLSELDVGQLMRVLSYQLSMIQGVIRGQRP